MKSNIQTSQNNYNLPALAKDEVLPTPGDFAIITSALDIPEEERQKIWQGTCKPSWYQAFLDFILHKINSEVNLCQKLISAWQLLLVH